MKLPWPPAAGLLPARHLQHALLKRRCVPEDLAEVIVFLGFGAAMVTGQTVTVDGGLTL